MSTKNVLVIWETIQKQKGKPFLITGSAGSGKSFILRELAKYLESQSISYKITASTWMAALRNHSNGTSIHSFMGMQSLLPDNACAQDIIDTVIGKQTVLNCQIIHFNLGRQSVLLLIICTKGKARAKECYLAFGEG